MKPTDARVGYDWLTPASDWTDATPKFLAATYVRPKTQTASSDGRRYGGFIVRVYFDGQLQDSTSDSAGTNNAVSGRGSSLRFLRMQRLLRGHSSMPCKVVSRRRNFLQLLAAKVLLFT